MSSRANQAKLARDQTFLDAVEAACVYAALQIKGESQEAPHHDQRYALALTFLIPDVSNRHLYLNQFAWMAAMNPSILTECTDGNGNIDASGLTDNSIDYVVASLWDQMSGVGLD